MYPHLTAEQQSRVVDEVVRFLDREMLPGQVRAGCPSLEVGQGTA